MSNGEVFTGVTHFIAMEAVARAGYFDWPGITTAGTEDEMESFDPYEEIAHLEPTDGWITNDGKFVYRDEAARIAAAAGQTRKDTGSLHSGDYPNIP